MQPKYYRTPYNVACGLVFLKTDLMKTDENFPDGYGYVLFIFFNTINIFILWGAFSYFTRTI